MIKALLLVIAMQRSVAVTVDDLPAVVTGNDLEVQQQITADLLKTFNREKIPAIGFVNEGRLLRNGHPIKERVRLLEKWLDAGLELGNHSFSHPDLQTTPISEYEADVLNGEKITRRLLAKRAKEPRYFRHPFLHTGPDLATRTRFEAFLKRHGYRVAPVTIDNNDYIFARAYDRALDKGDTKRAREIGAEYVTYMERIFAYCERQSLLILGYEPRQTLLLHANRLNAAYMDELAAMLRQRGYRFISLEHALADPAYRKADRYAGRLGITWLHRWAITDGKDRKIFAGEPEVPASIENY